MNNNDIREHINTAYREYGLIQNPVEIYDFCKFYQELDCKNILEIGTFFGGTFYLLCKLSNSIGKKISIDFPIEGYAGANSVKENLSIIIPRVKSFAQNVEVLTLDSHLPNTLKKTEDILQGELLDFLFIDGDHTYEGVKKDYEMYKHLVKDGGYIAFHDINQYNSKLSKDCQVDKFWREILQDEGISTFEFNQKSYGGIGVVQVRKHKKKLDLDVWFEAPGKINIRNNSHNSLNLMLSVKDKHTNIPIYYCDLNFGGQGSTWYIMPIGDTDWLQEKYLNTFKLEFYDESKNLVDTKELEIKQDRIGFSKIGTRHFSPFECLWINYKQMFLDKIYDKFEMDNLESVIDVGANVGMFTNYISNRGAKKIFAIEPTQRAFNELKNQFYYYNGVQCKKMGIGSQDEMRTIYVNNDNSLLSSFLSKTSENITEENIEVLRLPSFCKRNNLEKVDLIKVDIEGMEYEVFDSMSDAEIAICERYLIEYHSNETGNADRLINRFRNLAYEVEVCPDFSSNVQGHFFAKKKMTNEKVSEFPKRAFVTFTNDYYLPITERLVKSIGDNSEYPIIVYSVNCDMKFSHPKLYTKRVDINGMVAPKFITENKYMTRKHGEYEIEHTMPKDFMGIVDRSDIGTYLTLSRKPLIILDAINNGLEEGIFLDADGLVKENIDSAFEYLKDTENYPLIGKGLFEYILLNGLGNPHVGDCLEKPLMDLLGVKDRSMHYVSTNFILFTNKMKGFIQEWANVADDKTILNENVKYAPYHDETIVNVLLWKWKATKHLPIVHYNLTNSQKAKEFYETDKTDIHTDSEWHYIPSDINDIKYFHGCKSLEELDKTIELINSKKVKFNYEFEKLSFAKNAKIAIVTLFDSNYSDLGKIAIPNRAEYAKKHGYDCIYFTETIDKTRPPQWSKIKAVEYFLNEYEWVWWLDIDALVIDTNKKLESIIDNKYDIIFTDNKYSVISNGSSFFRNTPLTKRFLKECYELNRDDLRDVDVHTFDHEQKPMRKLYMDDNEYRSKIKLVHERVCNSFYQTNNQSVLDSYPNWNHEDNIYQAGDFVVNFCGRSKDERISIMKEFTK